MDKTVRIEYFYEYSFMSLRFGHFQVTFASGRELICGSAREIEVHPITIRSTVQTLRHWIDGIGTVEVSVLLPTYLRKNKLRLRAEKARQSGPLFTVSYENPTYDTETMNG